MDIWKFLAGLAIFLMGMSQMEEAVRRLGGRSFKKFIRNYTANPFSAIFVGIVVTALLQSSSVVSLIVLAFVGAGAMRLRNALGVVIGANLGTTMTGWIVAAIGFKLDIEGFALPMLAVGGLAMMFFQRRDAIADGGRMLLGFGFLFLGLEFMKTSIELWANTFDPAVFAAYPAQAFFLVGFVFTAIIQSSSATMAITLAALSNGVLTLDAAAAMVIGADLGTTITTIFGSLKGTAAKRQLALGQFLFNLIADLVALALLYPLLSFVHWITGGDPLFTLVAFHSSFNLFGILLLIPFLGAFERFLEKRFTARDGHASRFIPRVTSEVPEAGMEALQKELAFLIDRVVHFNISSIGLEKGLFQFPEYPLPGLPPADFSRKPAEEMYEEIKRQEGEILQFSLGLQEEELNRPESKAINRYQHAVRQAVQSAKGVKDILHNIADLNRSGNDTKIALFEMMKGQQHEIYRNLFRILHNEPVTVDPKAMSGIMKECRKARESIQTEVYRQATRGALSELEVSTMLNVNRELYHAAKDLIQGCEDLFDTRED